MKRTKGLASENVMKDVAIFHLSEFQKYSCDKKFLCFYKLYFSPTQKSFSDLIKLNVVL